METYRITKVSYGYPSVYYSPDSQEKGMEKLRELAKVLRESGKATVRFLRPDVISVVYVNGRRENYMLHLNEE